MGERPLPEAIRGAWYSVPLEPQDVDEALESDGEVLVFRLDETFDRYQVEEGELEEDERAEYTFDGDFLILRGSSTVTFRVDQRAPWHWELEAKSGERRLLRGKYEGTEPVRLAGDRADEIERLPGRVFVKSEFSGHGSATIGTLVHESTDGDEVDIGAVCAEFDDEMLTWIGATPFVDSIPERTWKRVVREAYFEIYLDAPPLAPDATLRLATLDNPMATVEIDS